MNVLEVITRIEKYEELLRYINWTYNHTKIMKEHYNIETDRFLIRGLQNAKEKTEKEIFELKQMLENTKVEL